MRVDEVAAARANMRERTRSPDTPRFAYTKEQVKEFNDRQRQLNYVMASCGHCCNRCTPVPPTGKRISCALITLDVPMNAEEHQAAAGCQIPALFAAVWDGEKKDLQRSEALKAIPFDVPPETIRAAEVEEAGRAVASGTYKREQAELVLEQGVWNAAWGPIPEGMKVQHHRWAPPQPVTGRTLQAPAIQEPVAPDPDHGAAQEPKGE